MPFTSWLRTLQARFQLPHGRRPRPARRPRRSRVALAVEPLEDRTVPSTFTVTTTADNGDNTNPTAGSLRQAILLANQHANDPGGPDTIAFAIPTTDAGYNSTTGAFTIQPPSALPAITDPVVIDGYTQAGATANTLLGPCGVGSTDSTLHPEKYGDNTVLKVELDGENAGNAAGLSLAASNSIVQGLVINRFASYGIDVGGASDVIQGAFGGGVKVGGEVCLRRVISSQASVPSHN
jgi:CSLREA domain-containing protein